MVSTLIVSAAFVKPALINADPPLAQSARGSLTGVVKDVNAPVWTRNRFNVNYYDLLSAAPGNSGLYVGQPGDPGTVGVTLRLALKAR
jgi:hypothetical protein